MILFGDKLKELRKEKNLTQTDIAKMFNVKDATVSAWEVGKSQPSFEIVKELAKYFGVSIDYLLGFNQEDKDNITKLNQALREAGMVNNDETLKEEEIRLALEQARQYKEMWKRINDLPNKYPEGSIRQENIKDTNE